MSFRNFKLGLKKATPTILTVTGIVGFVGTVVLASNETIKAQTIIRSHKDTINNCKEAMELMKKDGMIVCVSHDEVTGETINEEVVYTNEDYKKDIITTYSCTAKELFKIYWPSILTGVLSISSILVGNHILNKRLAASISATASISAAFRKYRDRVIEKEGIEQDMAYRYGEYEETVKETVTDKNGKEKTVEKKVKKYDISDDDPLVVNFDPETSKEYKEDHYRNLLFINNVWNWANDILDANTNGDGYGYLVLNEVFKNLGLPCTEFGQTNGWVFDRKTDLLRKISFGYYFDHYNELCEGFEEIDDDIAKKAFIDAYLQNKFDTIPLEFNIDGNVWEIIKEKKKLAQETKMNELEEKIDE